MYRLTNEQLKHIQAYVDTAIDALANQGLTFSVDHDMAAWVQLMASSPGTVAVTPSFDPQHSHVHPENCFWSKLENREGKAVACLAMRLFVTDDILEDIRSWRLFFNREPVLDFHVLELVAPYNAPRLSGRVGYSGGFWMHPDLRGRQVSGVFSRAHRALALRHFDLDWACGLNVETPTRHTALKETFGFTGSFSCINGYFPGRRAEGRYQLAYTSRGDMLTLIKDDLAAAAQAETSVERETAAAE